MAKKTSGQELIEHNVDILGNIGKHFNNPDISDVTLTVGEQVFAVHRFILATQSKVFMIMLMGEDWKESEKKNIPLQESAEGDAAFSDFLKFLYTGSITLTIDNVCGIHTLADKYDIAVLKDDCVGFMKDVLTGIHGDALEAGLLWLQYTESFLPDTAALCFSAIRTNFLGVLNGEDYTKQFWKLTYNQVETVLSVPEVQEELVLFFEDNLLKLLNLGKWSSRLTPFVRFYNIDIDMLRSYEGKNTCKTYFNQAYKVHAERSEIVSKACKRRKLSHESAQVTCPCDESNSQVCPHINPRLYLHRSYACMNDYLKVEPVDLSDLAGYSHKLLFPDDTDDDKCWVISSSEDYEGEPICESYIVQPSKSHVGKRFTIAIGLIKKPNREPNIECEYTIKYTGEVTSVTGADANCFTLNSPYRFKDSWKASENHNFVVAILLHK